MMGPERAFRWACCLDLRALKPGNVGSSRPGHRMSGQDFITSARHAAPVLATPGLGLGERIHQAVAATRAAVHCNTNLGILLLCAPLLQAAQQQPDQPLHGKVIELINAAGQDDTEQVFLAIRLAEPGGLGGAPAHDVRDPADAPLLEVMAAAAHRDRVAREYANGFSQVLGAGLDTLLDSHQRWRSPSWAMTATFMRYLAMEPDSHIQRRHGPEVAREVMHLARPLQLRLANARDPRKLRQALLELDDALHARGINPGTCADLAVATTCAAMLEPSIRLGGRHGIAHQRRGLRP